MLIQTDYIIIALYFLLILIVGFWTGKKQGKEEFLIAGRQLKTFEATATIFSSRIGAAILLTYTALVYIYGLGAYWYFIGSVFGLFVFYFFGKKVKKIADKQKFYTLPDFFFHFKGQFAGKLATLVTIITMFGWVVINFTAGAKLVAQYTPISYNFSVVIIGVIILLYLLAGGFKAVVKTDIVQTIGIFLLFMLMLYLLVNTNSRPNIVISELFDIPLTEIVSFFFVGLFTPMASPELWQRVYAVKDESHLKKSLFLSSIFYFAIGFILLLIGLIIRENLPNIHADESLIKGFSALLPAGLAGLSVVIIYSAISSSADTYLFTSAASVTQDFLEKAGFTRKENLRITMRLCMTILMFFGISLALILKDIVDTTFFFAAITMSLGFLILVIWIYPGINRRSVNFSISLCLVGVITPSIIDGISTDLVIYALGFCMLGVLIGIVVNYLKPENSLSNENE